MSVFAVFPSYATTSEDETIAENTVSELEPVETEDQIFDRLTADSLMLNYIDETAFRAAGHVNRLPEEEDLNSYVFENEDGTRTAYILAEYEITDSDANYEKYEIGMGNYSADCIYGENKKERVFAWRYDNMPWLSRYN